MCFFEGKRLADVVFAGKHHGGYYYYSPLLKKKATATKFRIRLGGGGAKNGDAPQQHHVGVAIKLATAPGPSQRRGIDFYLNFLFVAQYDSFSTEHNLIFLAQYDLSRTA